MAREYSGIDLTDFYRGKLSPRRLGVLVRGLSRESATATAVNGGPVWGPIEHLLADIWVVLVRANSKKGSLPEDFDHPERAKMTAKAKDAAKAALKADYQRRKQQHRQGRR